MLTVLGTWLGNESLWQLIHLLSLIISCSLYNAIHWLISLKEYLFMNKPSFFK